MSNPIMKSYVEYGIVRPIGAYFFISLWDKVMSVINLYVALILYQTSLYLLSRLKDLPVCPYNTVIFITEVTMIIV